MQLNKFIIYPSDFKNWFSNLSISRLLRYLFIHSPRSPLKSKSNFRTAMGILTLILISNITYADCFMAVEKNNRTIEFVSHIVDTKKQNTIASFRARNEALIKILNLINELEK